MTKQLPIKIMNGSSWYVDHQLEQFRRVDNPHAVVTFEHFDRALAMVGDDDLENGAMDICFPPDDPAWARTLENLKTFSVNAIEALAHDYEAMGYGICGDDTIMSLASARTYEGIRQMEEAGHVVQA